MSRVVVVGVGEGDIPVASSQTTPVAFHIAVCNTVIEKKTGSGLGMRLRVHKCVLHCLLTACMLLTGAPFTENDFSKSTRICCERSY